MATIADLRSSFTVGLAFHGADGVPVYSVSADGFQSYVRDDDQETIDTLLNPSPELVVLASATAAAVPAPLPDTASLAEVIAAVNELTGASTV